MGALIAAAVLAVCLWLRAGRGAGLPEQDRARDHPARRRRRRRHLHPRHERRIAEAAGADLHRREPHRRRPQHRHPRLRGSGARRLHALRPLFGADRLQPVPVQVAAVQSREGFRADHQPVLQHARLCGEQFAEGEDRPGADGARQETARQAQLLDVLVPAGPLHGRPEQEVRASTSCACLIAAATR